MADLGRSETSPDVLDRAYKAAYETQRHWPARVDTAAIEGFRAGARALLEHLEDVATARPSTTVEVIRWLLLELDQPASRERP